MREMVFHDRKGLVPVTRRPAQGSRVLPAHPSLDERFVDEDEAAGVGILQKRAELFPAFAVLRRVALDGDE